MPKIQQTTINDWRERATHFLGNLGHKLEDVKVGRDAWTVAHKTDMIRDAYKDESVVDAHIQTALQKIFPNVIFKDKKRY